MANFITNLVSSWEMEQAATPFVDDAGRNPLAISGVTLQQPGIFNFCGSYDGVNDDAEISHASQVGLVVGTGSFSIEAWMKSSSTPGEIVSKFDNVVSDTGYRMTVNNEGLVILVAETATVNKVIVGSTPTNTGNLFQLVGVWDRVAQLLKLYVNGSSDATAVDISSVGSLNNNEPFCIGSLRGAGVYFNGLIDRVRFWNGRALTASEVSTLYNGNIGLRYSQLSVPLKNKLPSYRVLSLP